MFLCLTACFRVQPKTVTGTKIETRHMVFNRAEEVFWGKHGKGNNEGIEARNNKFKEEAVKLSLQSAAKTLADWGGPKEDITHVIGVSCTGVIIPGLEFHIMAG
jgi:predicted naringenin-chalcone synthase